MKWLGSALAVSVAVLILAWGLWASGQHRSLTSQESPPMAMDDREDEAAVPHDLTPKQEDYPQLSGQSVSFSDTPNLLSGLPLRNFDIPMGESRLHVTAARLRFIEDADRRIFEVADLDAGYTEAFSKALTLPGTDVPVTLHIGDFAQDYCGRLDVLYTVERDGVFALAFAQDKTALLFEGMACDIARTPDSPDDFCPRRVDCVRAFMQSKPTESLLQPSLDVVRLMSGLRFE